MRRTVSARSLVTKRAVAREFAHHGSGYVLAAAIGVALAGRRRWGGRLSVRDLAAVAAIVAAQPFVEWFVHRSVLHGPPRAVGGGRTVDIGAPHRGHHRVPDDVSGALLGGSFAAADALVTAAVAAPLGLVVGGGLAAALTATAAGEGGLAAYEWVHLLSHSGYRGRTRWFRARRAAHLRHHYRDERADFGITSGLADRLFGTSTTRAPETPSQPGRTGTA